MNDLRFPDFISFLKLGDQTLRDNAHVTTDHHCLALGHCQTSRACCFWTGSPQSPRIYTVATAGAAPSALVSSRVALCRAAAHATLLPPFSSSEVHQGAIMLQALGSPASTLRGYNLSKNSHSVEELRNLQLIIRDNTLKQCSYLSDETCVIPCEYHVLLTPDD